MKKVGIILFVLIIGVIIFYFLDKKEKLYYLALGDSVAAGQNPYREIGDGYSDYVANYLEDKGILKFYTNDFAISGYKTTDLINDINGDKEIMIDGDSISIINALKDADIITLSIGANDFLGNFNTNIDEITVGDYDYLEIYNTVNTVQNKVSEVIQKIKTYSEAQIILIGYYNPFPHVDSEISNIINPIFKYGNDVLNSLADANDIFYIDVFTTFENNSSYLPNSADIHPNLEGYKAISKLIINILENEILD